jgi:predicted MFS family arabinose efflux permease
MSESMPRPPAPESVSGPSASSLGVKVTTALVVLTLVNLLNYVDRFIIAALLPDIERELRLSNSQGGLLGSAFILVYAIASPVFGWGGDRGVRTRWISAGVGLWSLATGLAGFARSFVSLLGARALVGVGEAAYGTISPALLSDYAPKNRRGNLMSIFFLAIPAGSALGYVLGGVLGQHFGWRAAFFAVGFPGLLLAVGLWFMREPQRGRCDEPSERGEVSLRQAYGELAHNRVYVWTVLGYIAYTFAIGGLAYWMPSYIRLTRGLPLEKGMLLFGGITVVTGIVGTLAGGAIGDWLQARTPNGYTWLNIVAMSAGAALALAALLVRSETGFLALLTGAELLLFANTGPVNALIVDSVRPGARATASATAILAIHLFGDAISPWLLGRVADHASLQAAMLLLPAVFLLAGGLWLGSYQRRARHSWP